MEPPENDPIISGTSILLFRHLENQNPSIISGDIGRARSVQQFWNRTEEWNGGVQLILWVFWWFRDISAVSMVTIVFKALIVSTVFRSSAPFCSVPFRSVPELLHTPCSAYISSQNGRILMFKVSKGPYRCSQHDEIICKWRHDPPGGENLN